MRFSTLLAACLVCCYAQETPDAAALLKQSTDSLKQRKSYQMRTEVTTEMTVASQPLNLVVTADVFAINPDKIRVESTDSTGGGATIVSTGESIYLYLQALKQYKKTSGVSNVRQMLNSTGLTHLPDEAAVMRNARILRQEDIETGGVQFPCWVVETKIDKLEMPPPAGGAITDSVLTMWIDKKEFFVRRSIMTGKMQVGPITSEMKQESRLRSIQLDPTLPDSLFTFVAPDGAKEVTEFGGGGAGSDSKER